MPDKEEDIAAVMGPYSALGFPGAIGELDAVHVHWDKCPREKTNLHTGKEGYPSIAYELIVSHDGRALSCTAGFYGACNDKTIVRFDGAVQRIRRGFYKHVSYDIYLPQVSSMIKCVLRMKSLIMFAVYTSGYCKPGCCSENHPVRPILNHGRRVPSMAPFDVSFTPAVRPRLRE
jgi:hypothetical protein